MSNDVMIVFLLLLVFQHESGSANLSADLSVGGCQLLGIFLFFIG